MSRRVRKEVALLKKNGPVSPSRAAFSCARRVHRVKYRVAFTLAAGQFRRERERNHPVPVPISKASRLWFRDPRE